MKIDYAIVIIYGIIAVACILVGLDLGASIMEMLSILFVVGVVGGLHHWSNNMTAKRRK